MYPPVEFRSRIRPGKAMLHKKLRPQQRRPSQTGWTKRTSGSSETRQFKQPHHVLLNYMYCLEAICCELRHACAIPWLCRFNAWSPTAFLPRLLPGCGFSPLAGRSSFVNNNYSSTASGRPGYPKWAHWVCVKVGEPTSAGVFVSL